MICIWMSTYHYISIIIPLKVVFMDEIIMQLKRVSFDYQYAKTEDR